MEPESYFKLINYLLVANTVWVAGFAVLCFIWASIARTPAKKTIFGAMGGFLALSVGIRIVVAMLPANLQLLLLIGIIHGIMMAVMFVGFLMVTVIVKKRTHEAETAEQCRAEACQTPAVQRLATIESELIAIGRSQGWC